MLASEQHDPTLDQIFPILTMPRLGLLIMPSIAIVEPLYLGYSMQRLGYQADCKPPPFAQKCPTVAIAYHASPSIIWL